MFETDFTRNRKQSFHGSLVFMINFLTKSLSVEIVNFISFIKYNMPGATINGITKSAFVQYRKKIKPEVFKSLSDSLIEEFYTDNDGSIKLWNGFRLLAVDGSRLVLPDTQELESIYGRTKNQSETGVVQARISVLYDVLNRFAIDGVLAPMSTGESVLAFDHLVFAKANDLIIYDRGYPSFNLIYEHFEKGIDFLIRVKADFSNLTREFHQSGLRSAVVRMQPGRNIKLSDKPYTKNTFKEVRLVRVELPDREAEILVTSLFDSKEYPDSIFKELYFLRWGIETFYDELKNKIRIEHFSGYSGHCILQDFYAALFVSNVQSLIVGEINDELAKESTQYRYQYKVNGNLSYGFLKDRIILLFFSDKDMDEIVSELKALFKKHTIPIRPNRRFERNTDMYRKKGKPKLLKNNKSTF